MRTRVRSALVVSEVALALVLLVGAGLLLKSFGRLLEVRPGFNPESVLATTINLPAARYREAYQQKQFVDQLLDRLGSLSEVRQAAVSAGLPFSGVSDAGVSVSMAVLSGHRNPERPQTITALRLSISRPWESRSSVGASSRNAISPRPHLWSSSTRQWQNGSSGAKSP